MKLLLFTTAGCHLCDKAKAEIWSLPSSYDVRLEFVDIADVDELIVRYGTRIPVLSKATLASESSEAVELCWPFTQEMLQEFLSV